MRKLMSALLIGFMALGIVGMILVQPIEAQASGDPFKDFKVEIDADGNVSIDSDLKDEDGVERSPMQTIIERYKGFIVGISGIAAVTMVVMFMVQFMKLGASADNPNARKAAISGIIFTGIAAALLGSVSLITGIFYGFMN